MSIGLTSPCGPSSSSDPPHQFRLSSDIQGCHTKSFQQGSCNGDLNPALTDAFSSGNVINLNYTSNHDLPVNQRHEKLEEWQLVPDELLLYFTGKIKSDENDTGFFRNLARELRICYQHLEEIKLSYEYFRNTDSSSCSVCQEAPLCSEDNCSDSRTSWFEEVLDLRSLEDELKNVDFSNTFSSVTSTEESLSSFELALSSFEPEHASKPSSATKLPAQQTLSPQEALLPYVDDNKEEMFFSLVQSFSWDTSDQSPACASESLDTNLERKVIDQQPQSLPFWPEVADNGKHISLQSSSSAETSPPISTEGDVRVIQDSEEVEKCDKSPAVDGAVGATDDQGVLPEKMMPMDNAVHPPVPERGSGKPPPGNPQRSRKPTKPKVWPRLPKFWSEHEEEGDIDKVKVPSVPVQDLVFHVNEKGAIQIGEGSFGSVFLADLYSNGAVYQVVVKDFSPKGVTKPLEILEEARILMHLLDTAFIPYFYGVLHVASPQRFALVQEFYGQGRSLHNLLEDTSLHLNHVTWVNLCLQMAVGLERFHQKAVLLNDIKKDNILVDYRDGHCMLKFIDMGLATYKTGRVFYGSQDYMKQFNHLAPEVRRLQQTSPASDVYSVGKILFSIAKVVSLSSIKDIALPCLDQFPQNRPNLQSIICKVVETQKSLRRELVMTLRPPSIPQRRWYC